MPITLVIGGGEPDGETQRRERAAKRGGRAVENRLALAPHPPV